MNISYRALTIEQIPRLMVAYKSFYISDAKMEMSETYQQNLLDFVIKNFTNPDFLFLIACSGKKIAGFAVLTPTPSWGGVKTVIIEPLWIVPEYRNKGIGEKMVEILKGWTDKKEVKVCLTYEKPEGGVWSRKKYLGFRPYLMIMKREV